MTDPLGFQTATTAEMRKPHKVLERAGGQPVAILRGSAVLAYFVPAEWVENGGRPYETMDEIIGALRRGQAR